MADPLALERETLVGVASALALRGEPPLAARWRNLLWATLREIYRVVIDMAGHHRC